MQDVDKFENQVEGDVYDSCQCYFFQFGGVNVYFSVVNVDDQDYGGEDQILCFIVIYF